MAHYHAIKVVYDRPNKRYTVDHKVGDHMLVSYIHSGYYVTDSLTATLGLITLGRCDWYNDLRVDKKLVVCEWLMANA